MGRLQCRGRLDDTSVLLLPFSFGQDWREFDNVAMRYFALVRLLWPAPAAVEQRVCGGIGRPPGFRTDPSRTVAQSMVRAAIAGFCAPGAPQFTSSEVLERFRFP